jgi:hypothetical protein
MPEEIKFRDEMPLNATGKVDKKALRVELSSIPGSHQRKKNTVGDVRFWHIADVALTPTNVRLEGNNGHGAKVTRCLLLTLSRHRRDSEPAA